MRFRFAVGQERRRLNQLFPSQSADITDSACTKTAHPELSIGDALDDQSGDLGGQPGVNPLVPSQRMGCAMANLVPFTIDLTAHEATRLAAVLDALGPHWNPLEVYTGEAQAYHRLYAELDADQQATYEALQAAGMLPELAEA